MKFIIFILLISLPNIVRPQNGAWSSTGSLAIPRAYHKAVVLHDGKVLISGGARYVNGSNMWLSSCEIYDPMTGSWTLTDSLNTRRYFHTMSMLPDGKVLVTGGAYASGNMFIQLNSCELYDPSTQQWTPASSMNVARAGHTATLLQNGKVLVAGGNYSTSPTTDLFLRSCEIYDPALNQWTIVDSMSTPRKDHSATLLPNGSVLVVSGHYAITYPNIIYLKSCEIYDPLMNSWSVTDSLSTPQSGHASVVLPDSRLLIAGGYYAIKNCQVFHYSSMTWSSTDTLRIGRDRHSLTLLPNGKVLAAGLQGISTKCELYDPSFNIWALTDSLPYDVSNHSAVLLNNGKVLISGGYSYAAGGYLSNCLLFDYNVATGVNHREDNASPNGSLDAYPNPFNSSTVIRYTVASRSHVQIQVFDIVGKLICTVVDQTVSNGLHTVQWYGNTTDGTPASSGVYFCRFQVDGRIVVLSRLMMIK